MAVHDHTAPARPSFPHLGDPFSRSRAANATAHAPTHAPRICTFDDVALALYALTNLCIEDDRRLAAQARQTIAGPAPRPLPPRFRQGLTMAIQCLEQYARQLGNERAVNA